VGFEVIPAIDVADGRLARFTPEGFVPIEAFGADPLAAAEAFAAAGALRIHVVDMDLAFTGEAGNLEVVRSITRLGVPVQASGGIATRADAESLLEAGADRVVLGSAMLLARPLLAEAMRSLGERAAVALELEDGIVSPRGRVVGRLPLGPTLVWLEAARPARCVVTAVARVGAGAGPDLEVVRAVSQTLECPVGAAGGVASVADLQALARVPGVEGAVVGRAVLEGELDLDEAIRAFA
jgi:phosphoribosylformimino-5-aminoimidazole carboxamide ribonucleotide (ProFAR) isomerase